MKVITVYVASDGTRWDRREDAEKRDRLVEWVEEIMRPIGNRPDGMGFSNGGYFVQHKIDTLTIVRIQLFVATKSVLGKTIAEHEAAGEKAMDFHPSWFMRMLDGCDSPIADAWNRFWCIDENGREWGQPYYAKHPEESAAIKNGVTVKDCITITNSRTPSAPSLDPD